MARDDGLEEAKLASEMPSQLKELLEMQLNRSKMKDTKYQTLDVRWEGAKSIFSSDAEFPLPPPLLTSEEREQMRKYRREAVKCEQRLFEIRREKYSSLLLQVMAISDRMQEKELCHNIHVDDNGNTYDTKKSSSQSQKRSDEEHKDNCKERVYNQKRSSKSDPYDDHVKSSGLSAVDFQHANHEQNHSCLDDLIDTQAHENSVTNDFQTKSKPGVFKKNICDDISETSVNTVMESTTSTLCEPSKMDSLASTSLSFAYTDYSAISSVDPEPTKSAAQRRLALDDSVENSTKSQIKSPALSLSKTLNESQYQPKKVLHRSKSHEKISASKLSRQELDNQQKLDLIKQEIQHEKTKLLKQQVLSRLRSQRIPEEQTLSTDEVIRSAEAAQSRATNPADERRPKLPSRNNYSIGDTSYDTVNQFDTKSAPVYTDEYHNKLPEESAPSSQPHQEIDFHKIPTEELHLHLTSQTLPEEHESVKQSSNNILSKNSAEAKKVLAKEKFDVITAVAKGFLTRRLLKADKVQALLKTVKDTGELLADIAKEDGHSSQDKTLQDRVYAQFQAAKLNIYDIFHNIPASERMAYISHSRNLAKEREAKKVVKRFCQQRQTTGSSLSAATVKAIQRRSDGIKYGQEKKPELKRRSTSPLSGRKNWDIRVLKPRQGNTSPPLPDKARSKREGKAVPKETQSGANRPLTSQAKLGGAKGSKTIKQQQQPKSSVQETQTKKQTTRANAAGKTSVTHNAAPTKKRTVAAKFTGR